MKSVWLGILLFLGSLGYAQWGKPVLTDRFTGVIFSGRDYDSPESLKNLGYAVGENVIGTWTPTKGDVMMLEIAFINTLQSVSRWEAREILDALGQYRRQYLGVVVSAQHLMMANFDRCSTFEEGQLEASFIPFLPEDGGTCFIELLFDTVAKTFYRIYIHGEA